MYVPTPFLYMYFEVSCFSSTCLCISWPSPKLQDPLHVCLKSTAPSCELDHNCAIVKFDICLLVPSARGGRVTLITMLLCCLQTAELNLKQLALFTLCFFLKFYILIKSSISGVFYGLIHVFIIKGMCVLDFLYGVLSTCRIEVYQDYHIILWIEISFLFLTVNYFM